MTKPQKDWPVIVLHRKKGQRALDFHRGWEHDECETNFYIPESSWLTDNVIQAAVEAYGGSCLPYEEAMMRDALKAAIKAASAQ